MTMEPSLQQASAPPPAPCWSNIVKQQLQSPSPSQHQPAKQQNLANQELLLDSCKSAHGISMAVIDANAVIQGGEKLHNLADKFVTVPEVMAEIRDPVSRHRLSLIPFSIDSIEPTPESLNKVIKFARATGDLQTLSDVDLKLIALTYTLEAQLHGTQHLRDAPPPVHTINVKRFPEKDLPGWGSNVPNLEEWEALEQEAGDGSDKFNSKILPLKDINLNIVQLENQAEDGSVGTREEANSENQDIEACLRGPRRYPPKKTVVKIEGKKMVADGVDASQGQLDDVAGDWMPAVSRSTHRRFLRRKGRREQCSELAEKEIQQDLEPSMDNNNVNEAIVSDEALDHTSEAVGAGNGMPEGNEMAEVTSENEDLSSILKHIRVEEGSRITLQEAEESTISTEIYIDDSASMEASCGYNADIVAEDVDIDSASASAELDHLEISSQTHESVDASYTDDIDSEHSLMLRSLSESSVACVTSDFAMQNVLLQMGLRLLAPGGNQIRQLHRWILKCHACYTVTAEIGRIFCPKCGNGGTLRKVAVTVGENGITLAARRPRITLRGTKFSLPTPQGGRNAIFKNLILREDQLPQKLLYPKTKKKAIKEGDDFVPGDIFSFTHHTDKKAPYRAPVRQALAVFSGKRNPNDNHYSRSKH